MEARLDEFMATQLHTGNLLIGNVIIGLLLASLHTRGWATNTHFLAHAFPTAAWRIRWGGMKGGWGALKRTRAYLQKADAQACIQVFSKYVCLQTRLSTTRVAKWNGVKQGRATLQVPALAMTPGCGESATNLPTTA